MHKRSFGWIAIKIHNEIKDLKVPTYDTFIGLGISCTYPCPLAISIKGQDYTLYCLVSYAKGIAKFHFEFLPIYLLLPFQFIVVFFENIVGCIEVFIIPVHFNNKRRDWVGLVIYCFPNEPNMELYLLKLFFNVLGHYDLPFPSL